MKRTFALMICVALLGCWAGRVGAEEAAPTILPRAHAHNDYLHDRPLLDALDQGFMSVEADIFLVGDQLLVAHTKFELKKARTLEELYLDPLMERVKKYGAVYPGLKADAKPGFTLLIDFKTDAETTWPALVARLEKYKDMFTQFENGEIRERAVTAIISGASPRAALTSPKLRYAALDGRVNDADFAAPVDQIPLISDSWGSHFNEWKGVGEPPAAVVEKMRGLVERAHAGGKRVRFWGGPDRPDAWKLQYELGVDLINTDKLADLAAMLKSLEAPAPK